MNFKVNLFMMAITSNISIATNYCADYFETKMYLVKSYFFIIETNKSLRRNGQ